MSWVGDDLHGWHRPRIGEWTGWGLAPEHEYRPPTTWQHPKLVKEINVDDDSVLRIVAMPEVNKYGNCYEVVYINLKKRIKRQLFIYPNEPRALASLPLVLAHVKLQKQRREIRNGK